MASTIAAVTTSGGGVVTTADASGNLNLLAGTTTVVAVTTAGAAVTGTLSATGVATFAAGTVALPSITTSGDTNTGIYFPAADTIAFTEGGAEAMRIDSSGNVGIGTTSPVNILSVNGGVSLLPYYETYLANSYYSGSWKYAGNGHAWGIGNNFGGPANGTTIAIAAVNAGGAGAALTWNPVFNINSSGNVGIGTTSPANKLDLQSPSATALCFHGLQSSVVEWQIGFKASDSNFYVGTGGTLGGAGLYQTNTGTAWIAVSDERLKKDITPLDDAKGLAGLLKLNPSTFYWKSEDAQQDLQIGLIAQNVQEHFPDLVSMGPVSEAAPDGAIGVNYTGFIAPLIKAIQELKAIIDTQATRIAALEAKA